MLDTLTLDQLRILIAVAEEGSFSAAARRLGRVQSGVSQAVQGLEEALDLALFDRSGRRPVLTEADRCTPAARGPSPSARGCSRDAHAQP